MFACLFASYLQRLGYSPAFNRISKAWKFAGSRRGPDKGHHIEARADWGETQIRAPCCGGDMELKGRIKPKAGLKSERIGLCLAYFKSVYFVKGMNIFFLNAVICDLWLFHIVSIFCFCSVSGPLKLARYCRKLQMKKAALQQNCRTWYYILLYINII